MTMGNMPNTSSATNKGAVEEEAPPLAPPIGGVVAAEGRFEAPLGLASGDESPSAPRVGEVAAAPLSPAAAEALAPPRA